ncbi:RagB/SusD family nutrient uptake outer membrane protein [Dyadobacter frigoris]|uniref:RagB/SusD family nutrient uptake outer membrane protein n=1 Tax=Dyadobacter frigoris TaxID=2576211 RepID=A0A4U6CPE8_9BACT|nr:RagB/SusD family nutrient uptake outer membrane protein [Dyadobacter frigoris]TKT85495.1 RagB/SusD family nutrient uptake outer membrane protein [Dyadobacter frigoris]GLU56228.1 membrane protein [Dyadobacter frigoris]
MIHLQKYIAASAASMLLAMFWLCSVCGCKQFLETDYPVNQLVTGAIFENDATALGAMSGVYEQMMESLTSYSNGMLTLYGGLSSDELVNHGSVSTKIEFYDNALSASNTELKGNVWDRLYSNIYQANSVLSGLEQSKMLSTPVRVQLEGEARFIRAFCHFYLVNLFGRVPYITTTDYLVNAHAIQMPGQKVYENILSDLKIAQSLLLDGSGSVGRIRPDKAAATALLARTYLYLEDWSDAETQASLVLDNQNYTLNTDLAQVFNALSKETIWQLRPVVPGTNAGDGYLFVQTTGTPLYASLSSQVMDAFETADKRKTAWVNSYQYDKQSYHLPCKYKIKSADAVTEYNVVFRLAELYLIRAEARASLNNLSGAQADINVIRRRAGLSGIEQKNTAADQSLLLQAIADERRIELFCEWGHRWFDLKRTGQINEIMQAIKPGSWQQTDADYPIPSSDLTNNPSLVQNPGYH